jgi:hypothetical protein
MMNKEQRIIYIEGSFLYFLICLIWFKIFNHKERKVLRQAQEDSTKVREEKIASSYLLAMTTLNNLNFLMV